MTRETSLLDWFYSQTTAVFVNEDERCSSLCTRKLGATFTWEHRNPSVAKVWGELSKGYTMLMFPMLSLLGQVPTLLSRSSNVSRKH